MDFEIVDRPRVRRNIRNSILAALIETAVTGKAVRVPSETDEGKPRTVTSYYTYLNRLGYKFHLSRNGKYLHMWSTKKEEQRKEGYFKKEKEPVEIKNASITR